MSGDAHSPQNCCGADKVLGGFNSHTPPPISNLFRQIPAVSDFLNGDECEKMSREFGEGMLKTELRVLLGELRTRVSAGLIDRVPERSDLLAALRERLLRMTTPRGRYAINATGILLHTGLGRSPLCREAIEALNGMGAYSILQVDLDSGKRSLREEKVERMLMDLTGCEAATVVNNNAAATMLVLNTLADHKEVIISRGQLIEIGGEFRMPDVMAKSSALMREVGTTNRTHLRDYEKAINPQTGALIHVHTSNYRVRGFTGVPDIRELCALGHRHSLSVIDDLGSGALVPLAGFGIASEPLVSESIRAGADAVCFSGDKLICGPQSGILCGKKEIIERIRKNPYARMFRVCKLTLAALEATLIHFVNGTYSKSLPFYQMLSVPMETLDARARSLSLALAGITGIQSEVIEDVSYLGSGSLPDEGIPSKVVRVRLEETMAARIGLGEIVGKLRSGMPSVFCRVQDEALCFDARTLFEGEEREIFNQLERIFCHD